MSKKGVRRFKQKAPKRKTNRRTGRVKPVRFMAIGPGDYYPIDDGNLGIS